MHSRTVYCVLKTQCLCTHVLEQVANSLSVFVILHPNTISKVRLAHFRGSVSTLPIPCLVEFSSAFPLDAFAVSINSLRHLQLKLINFSPSSIFWVEPYPVHFKIHLHRNLGDNKSAWLAHTFDWCCVLHRRFVEMMWRILRLFSPSLDINCSRSGGTSSVLKRTWA